MNAPVPGTSTMRPRARDEVGLAGSHGPTTATSRRMQAEAHITERLALGAVVAKREATGFDATCALAPQRQRLIRGDHAGRSLKQLPSTPIQAHLPVLERFQGDAQQGGGKTNPTNRIRATRNCDAQPAALELAAARRRSSSSRLIEEIPSRAGQGACGCGPGRGPNRGSRDCARRQASCSLFSWP